jgi:hypothetical protein
MRSLLVYFFILLSSVVYSQKNVSLTTIGIGHSEENAINNGIINSIQEIFGAFYSSNTQIVHDSLTLNEFAKVFHGNLKSYQINSSEKLNNGKWYVSISLIISLDELEKFYENSGQKVIFEGTTFSFNIQLQEFNEINEYKSISNLIEISNDILLNSFDYSLNVSDPISIDDLNENWILNFKIKSKVNSNIYLLRKVFENNLKSLSLNENEINDYSKLGKSLYQIQLAVNKSSQLYTLRNEFSFEMLKTFINSWEGYVRSFDLISNIIKIRGNSISQFTNILNDKKFSLNKIKILKINDFNEENDFYEQDLLDLQDQYYEKYNKVNRIENILKVIFPDTALTVGDFNIFYKFKFKDLENLNGFRIEPNNLLKFKNGGYLIFEENGHGLVLSPFKINYKDFVKNYKPNIPDFKSWYVPSVDNFKLISDNIFANHVGNIESVEYLSSSFGDLSVISITFHEVGLNEFSDNDYRISENQTAYISDVIFVKKY